MKLRWVNSHYIKKLDDDKLIELVRPHLENTYDLSNKSDEWIKDLILLYRDHLSYGKEIIEVYSLFFKEEISLDQECREFMQQEGIDETLKIFKDEISKIEEWNLENINIAINNTKEKSGAKGKMLYMPIRIKVTGQMHGPELPNTLYLLVKDIVLKILN